MVSSLGDVTASEYSKLNQEFRTTIAALIRKNMYTQVRNPNTKFSKNIPVSEYRSRVNILAKPSDEYRTGNKILKVGSFETLFLINARLIGDSYFSGLDMAEGGTIRMVMGGALAEHDLIFCEASKSLRSHIAEYKGLLYDAKYYMFAHNILSLAEDAILNFKLHYRLLPA